MKQTFDYLENVGFAATICDKEGIVLYQNEVARSEMVVYLDRTSIIVMERELVR